MKHIAMPPRSEFPGPMPNLRKSFRAYPHLWLATSRVRPLTLVDTYE
jgi:hypothetical protein